VWLVDDENVRPYVDIMQTETKMMDADNRDPRRHTQMMQQRLQQTIDHLRERH